MRMRCIFGLSLLVWNVLVLYSARRQAEKAPVRFHGGGNTKEEHMGRYQKKRKNNVPSPAPPAQTTDPKEKK